MVAEQTERKTKQQRIDVIDKRHFVGIEFTFGTLRQHHPDQCDHGWLQLVVLKHFHFCRRILRYSYARFQMYFDMCNTARQIVLGKHSQLKLKEKSFKIALRHTNSKYRCSCRLAVDMWRISLHFITKSTYCIPSDNIFVGRVEQQKNGLGSFLSRRRYMQLKVKTRTNSQLALALSVKRKASRRNSNKLILEAFCLNQLLSHY